MIRLTQGKICRRSGVETERSEVTPEMQTGRGQRGGAATLAPVDPADGGGTHNDDPQPSCGDDGAGAGAEKPVTPDP